MASLATLSLLAACRSEGEGPSPLSSAFEVLESRQDETGSKPPRGTLVDYESEVLVRPDRAELARRLAPYLSPLPEDPALEVLVARVETLAPRVTAVVDGLADYEAAHRAYWADGGPGGGVIQDDPRWRELAVQRREVLRTLTDLAYVQVSLEQFDGRWTDWGAAPGAELAEADLARAFVLGNERVRAMAPRPVPPGESAYRPDEIVATLEAVTAELARRTEAAEALAEGRMREVTLELEAALLRGGERLPVSIAPYTLVEGVGRGHKPRRVGVPDAHDLERVDRAFEATAEVAEAINELSDLVRDEDRRREALEALEGVLRRNLDQLRDGLERELEAFVAGTEAQLDAPRTRAEQVLATLRELEAAARVLVDGAERSTLPQLLRDVDALLRADLWADLEQGLDDLAADLAGVPDGLDAEARALCDALEAAVVDQLAQLRSALADTPGTAEVGALWTALSEVRELARQRGFGDVRPTSITRRPFELEHAPDGVVDLADTPADAGDVLEVRAELSVPGDGEPQVFPARRQVDVRKFGWYTTFNAQLLFYDRHGDGSSAFRAAPGVAYNFHYRPESAQDLFDVLAPGVGLSVSSPSFEDGTELAVGVQVTLLQNLVQVGYARNVSVSEDPDMTFFGLDLIELFQRTQ